MADMDGLSRREKLLLINNINTSQVPQEIIKPCLESNTFFAVSACIIMTSCQVGGFQCSRNSLILLNVFYIIVSFILIGTAAYAKATAYITDIAIVGGIIACGVFLLAISLIGIVATLLHHQVALFFYMIILGLLFVVQFSVACACLALNSKQQKEIFKAAWKESSITLKAAMQKQFQCCAAFKEDEEWDHVIFNNTKGPGHPACAGISPCCINNPTSYCCTGRHPSIQTETNATDTPTVTSTVTPSDTCGCPSCWEAIERDVDKGIKVSGGFSLFFSFSELMGVWLAFRFRNQKDPFADPNNFL